MMTNLFVLSGPPKKVDYKTSDLKHDYNDMKVSKMMKHVMSTYKWLNNSKCNKFFHFQWTVN